TRESSGNAFSLLGRQRLGSGTGIIDAFIAQTALDLNLPLHTFNVKHFRDIPGLTILQPYERD
ncbi:MAG: VapC toxin family PIN domain ribonuclease, partial [Caldilineaceae bacterium]